MIASPKTYAARPLPFGFKPGNRELAANIERGDVFLHLLPAEAAVLARALNGLRFQSNPADEPHVSNMLRELDKQG